MDGVRQTQLPAASDQCPLRNAQPPCRFYDSQVRRSVDVLAADVELVSSHRPIEPQPPDGSHLFSRFFEGLVVEWMVKHTGYLAEAGVQPQQVRSTRSRSVRRLQSTSSSTSYEIDFQTEQVLRVRGRGPAASAVLRSCTTSSDPLLTLDLDDCDYLSTVSDLPSRRSIRPAATTSDRRSRSTLWITAWLASAT